MTRTRTSLAVALLALAPVLVACGGDSTLTAKEFRSQAQALCKKASDDTDKLGKDIGANSSEKDIIAAIDKVVARNRKLVADIRDLKAPKSMSDDVDTMLKDVSAALTKFDDATLAELQSMENPFTKANEESKKLGLDACAND